MRELTIIGAGPAGLGAAIYGKRAGLDTLVLEKTGMSGGQILNTYEVDNYLGLPSINGFELGMKFREHANYLNVEFQDIEVTKIEPNEDCIAIHTSKDIIKSKYVVLANGASYNHLNIKGEEELTGKGVSYCATCDGAFFRNKTVAVVGGGDVAIEDAIFLSKICKKVYLIHRRDQLRGANILQNTLFQLENVEIIWKHTVNEIHGEGQVTNVTLSNLDDNSQRTLDIDGIFIAIGTHPNTNKMELPKDLTLANGGYIQADETGVTNIKNLYAIGDIRTKQLRQVITAVSDGANVITSIQNEMLLSHI